MVSQWDVLQKVKENPGLSTKELSEQFDNPASTMWRKLKKLSNYQFVKPVMIWKRTENGRYEIPTWYACEA